MSNKTETQNTEQFAGTNEQEVNPAPAPAGGKKQFVEPEISSPVNVLEVTTFFQAATSGATN